MKKITTHFHFSIFMDDFKKIEQICKEKNTSFSEFGRLAIHYVLSLLDEKVLDIDEGKLFYNKNYIKLEEVKKRHILNMLKYYKNNQTITSEVLGIGRSTLCRFLNGKQNI